MLRRYSHCRCRQIEQSRYSSQCNRIVANVSWLLARSVGRSLYCACSGRRVQVLGEISFYYLSDGNAIIPFGRSSDNGRGGDARFPRRFAR